MSIVVVLGSNSFSGSDFVDLLLRESEQRVVGVSRSPQKSNLFLPYLSREHARRFQFVQLDLNRDMRALQQLLAALEPAFVVNFASQSEVAPSWQNPEQWAQTNVVSTTALIDFLAGKRWLQRYLHISTPEVYGNCTGTVTEDAPFRPSTPYAASRAGAELMLQVFHRRGALPLSIVRSANVYGAHQQLHKILPRSVIYRKLGRTIDLHGGGYARRSFIHIGDVSRGELAVLKHGRPGEAYHLATLQTVAIRELVEHVCRLAGSSLAQCTREVGARPGHDDAYLLDCTKARRELGWEPRISLDEGIAQVVDWIDREWDRIRVEPLEYVHRR